MVLIRFETFGHDMAILHKQDIRKKTGAFNQMEKERGEIFLEDLNILLADADFTLLATVIDKYRLKTEVVERMKEVFEYSALFEWHFWDDAYGMNVFKDSIQEAHKLTNM